MKMTGKVYVRVNGELLLTAEGAKLSNITGIEREAFIGNQVHGHFEKAVAPQIECTIGHTKDTKLMELGKISNASVTFETDTGIVFLLREAWVANALELEGGGKGVTVKIMAMSVEEVS